MIFDKERLKKLSGNEVFSVWHYEAIGKDDASAARHQLGYFSDKSGLRNGDAIYITGGEATSHHAVQFNTHEKKFSLLLFGG